MFKRLVVGVSALFSTSSAFALFGSAPVALNVTGNIYPTPSWSVNGVVANSASYQFVSFSTGTINSNTVTLKLNNASTLNGDSIAITKPSGCAVGTGSIPSGNVNFTVGGNVYTANLISDFTGASGATTGIRFTNVNTTGAVNCSTAGNITYSY